VQQGKELYVGTTEQAAKLAPIKGLEPPVILTDSYPGFFCKQKCLPGERWGIISVSLKKLNEEMFAPSPAFIEKFTKKRRGKLEDRIQAILDKIHTYKTKWQKSLNGCGVCLYLANVPPAAIQKVMIYNPDGREANSAINKIVGELPKPDTVTASQHKASYAKSLSVLKWFNGEEVSCGDFNGHVNSKLAAELDDTLNNRYGLDVYYIKPEEKVRKSNVHKEIRK